MVDGLDIYEFGIGGGASLSQLLRAAAAHSKTIRQVNGFDSFQGLPQEEEDIPRHDDWEPGSFDARVTTESATPEEARQKVLQYLKENNPEQNIKLIGGWFADTLNQGAVRLYDMRAASYINIDSDLYISCRQALEFIFANKLYVKGTIIRYDDFYGGRDHGEALAHDEMIARYNIECEQMKIGCYYIIK
jgi:hypothetical protein